MQDSSLLPSLPQMALTVLISDFLRYALAAGAVWLIVHVLLRRRLAARHRGYQTPALSRTKRHIELRVAIRNIGRAKHFSIRSE